MNIFLIGYRCTGKTSVAKTLSEKLGMTFVDADDCVVAAEGRTIAAMVAAGGWDYFRRREKEIVKSICGRDNQVVATGGGVVLDADNVTYMKNCGKLIWLRAKAETIRNRLRRDELTIDYRPALTSQGAGAEIESVLIERTPYYQAAMDFSIDTDGRLLEDICGMIMRRLNSEQ